MNRENYANPSFLRSKSLIPHVKVTNITKNFTARLGKSHCEEIVMTLKESIKAGVWGDTSHLSGTILSTLSVVAIYQFGDCLALNSFLLLWKFPVF